MDNVQNATLRLSKTSWTFTPIPDEISLKSHRGNMIVMPT